tara:strand:- start:362 stop:511 length:150 start_codon:yes stop_codon:yes gene_type:complete
MGKVVKWLFYFMAAGTVALIIFAYIGPFLGFDFTPEEKTIIIPVELYEE